MRVSLAPNEMEAHKKVGNDSGGKPPLPVKTTPNNPPTTKGNVVDKPRSVSATEKEDNKQEVKSNIFEENRLRQFLFTPFIPFYFFTFFGVLISIGRL